MTLMLRAKKNTAATVVFPLTDSDGQPITGAAGLDSEYSHDGSAFGDCTNEATEIGSTGYYSLALEAAELNYSYVVVKVATSTAGVMPCHIMITTENDISVADIFGYVVENSKSFATMFRLAYATLCNKLSGAGSTTVYIRDDADSKDRIVATVDIDGNRSAYGTKDGS